MCSSFAATLDFATVISVNAGSWLTLDLLSFSHHDCNFLTSIMTHPPGVITTLLSPSMLNEQPASKNASAAKMGHVTLLSWNVILNLSHTFI